jgi:hypothetical protein
MDGSRLPRIRIALVDLDAERLDRFRDALAGALADGVDAARAAEVRLVVADDPRALPWRWAALAGVARAGELAALSEVVVDGVVVAAESVRAPACARLAGALGAHLLRLPAPSADTASARAPGQRA